jgi:integrase/recombinase XerC
MFSQVDRWCGWSIERVRMLGWKNICPPRLVRHRSIAAALDATNGDVRRVQQLSGHADLNTIRVMQ